jgi:UDP-N-acetylmuramate--alanine ligase
MKDEFVACFAENLAPGDVLVMPEPVYFGGTAERSVGSEDIVRGVRNAGRNAEAFATRAQCGDRLLELAQAGDRIVIMGARDDTLATFAGELLAALK